MSAALLILLITAIAPLALMALLRPALRAYEGASNSWLQLALDWLALLVLYPLDVLVAHTTWPLLAGWPRPGEVTVSHTLERLCLDTSHPDWLLFFELAKKINRASPTGRHIKAVLAVE